MPTPLRGNIPVLRSFFSYFGGKSGTARYYPCPRYDTVIEPFAGAAGYSVRHHTKKVLLYDKDPIICGLWEYLIRVTESEIRSLPLSFEATHGLNVCQEAKWLLGFWIVKGQSSPGYIPSPWMKLGAISCWGDKVRERVASQLRYIRHWRVKEVSYKSLPNMEATWFVDPPYQKAGSEYKFKVFDYERLGKWCRTRLGQVIVCEAEGVDWLPFRTFRSMPSTNHPDRPKVSHEVIWTNEV